jgi:hypothetical protein
MHTTAKSAIIESFKYRDIVFSLLVNAANHQLPLFNAGSVPNDPWFSSHSNHFIFNGMQLVAPFGNTSEIYPDGDFGAGLVVFNQLSADGWTRITALGVQQRS